MAIIYSYPTVTPEKTDLVLGTDVSVPGKPTKNFTVQSIIDLVTTATGDLQFVLNLGNTATGVDINLTNNAFRGGSFVTVGGATVSGTTGTGFTNITSTEFTGTIATPAQPNITSLGTLSALVISGPISGTGLITNSNLTGAQNDNVVSTLAIKTYVDNKVGLYDTLQEVLANGNTTGGSDIVVSAGDDVTFTDTSKILMGTTAVDNFEIYSDSANSIVIDRSPGALKLQTSLLSVRNEGDTTQTISASAAGAVELYHAGDKKIETLAGGAKVTGAFQATTSGTFASLVNTGTYTDSSGDVGTAGQLLSSTGSGTNWVTELPLYTWSLEGTAIPSGTAVTVTDGTNITTTWDATNFDLTIATTGVPDGSGAANQVTYWSDADTLTGAAGFTFAGGAAGKVAIAGELEVGGVLTDGTFTGSAGTYTGYVSITSTDFVGALTGNASTATALATSGAIALTGDTTSTGGPYTYTSGGALSIATTIADTTVTGKVLTNLATPTSTAIAASDTILAAMAKLQGQINGLAGSLAFEGTWNASTDTPTLSGTTPANGVFYIVSVAGNTNLDGITDWQVGDWAIYVDNGAGTDAWQKLDQSNEVLGSGAANKIAKWTSTNTLATGLIEDDGTTVTVGNSGNLVVEGNTTLGDADTDTTTVKGPGVFEETAQFNVGIGLSSTPDYGTAGQVLTSGGGSATANTWTTPTTGTVTSVGLTETGDALTITGSPITTNGTINIAGAGAASQYINGELNLVTFPTLDNYQYWVLSDGTNTTNISSTDTATFASGAGIVNTEASGTITTSIDITGADNAIAGLTAATPIATDTLWFNDISDSNTIRKATIADIVDLGNETLAQVLANGNASGANNIVMADSQKITFGASGDLEITHDTSNSYISTTSGSVGDLFIDSQGSGHDLYLQAADDVFIRPQGGQDGIKVIGNEGVELYGYNNSTSAMNKVFYTDDQGSGFPRAVAEKGLKIKNGSSSYGSLEYFTEGAGNNRGGIEINAANQSTGKRIFVGDAYIQGTTSSSPGFGLLPVVEFFQANNPATTIAKYQFSTSRAFIGSSAGDVDLKVTGDTEITGNLTVDGSIIHGSGKSGIFNGSVNYTGTTAAQLFLIKRTTTGQMIFDVFLTSGTAGGSTKKYTVAHKSNTATVYNKIIETTGTPDFTVAFANTTVTNTGDAVACTITPTATQTISYTIQVGFDNVNTVVVS